MKWLSNHWVLAFVLLVGACASGKADGQEDAGVSGGFDASLPSDASGPATDATPGSDGAVTAAGRTASGTVAGSVKASSPNYKLIGTVNKGDGTAKSAEHEYRGGVVGATQP